MPLEYASNNSAIYTHGCLYLINDQKTLKFDLGEIKDSSLPGNGISSTEKQDIPNVPYNPDKPVRQIIVTIQHNQGRNPTVKARYYEYAIGTEPSGLGSDHANSFGGINYQDLPIQVAYPDSNKVLIALPLKYASNNQIIFQNGKWYLIAGYQTICFDLGTIDSSKVPANSGSGSTSGGDSGQDNTNNQGLTPKTVYHFAVTDDNGLCESAKSNIITIIIASINGTVKSTLYRASPGLFKHSKRLNDDEILQAMGG